VRAVEPQVSNIILKPSAWLRNLADVLTTLALGAVSTFVPLYVGIFMPRLLSGSVGTNKLLAAYASGIIFWFFLDVMNDSALLGINQGFSGGYTHTALILLFAIGVAILIWIERIYATRNRSSPSNVSNSEPLQATKEAPGGDTTNLTIGVALAVALGVGFHALGEGIAIGAIVPSSSSILDAIGGLGPGMAYVLHKLLEGFVVGVVGVLAGVRAKGIYTLFGLISGIPTIIGFIVGLGGLIEATYFFALGGAAAVYIELKLVPIYGRGKIHQNVWLALLLGFYSIYVAGLFHG
jgi:zinc transporter ZupT